MMRKETDMPAYSFYPATYQPPYPAYYPAAYQQPVIQQQTQPQTVQQTQQSFSPSPLQNNIIWVSGESEASMYPVAPNSAVDLWDKSGVTVYRKQADATGRPMMKIYDLVERSEAASPVSASTDGSYATKEDLSAVAGIVSSLKSDIETMKSDIYGIAGKKKAVKKTEGDDE